MGLEVYRRLRRVRGVFEHAHDVRVRGTALLVDEFLLAPSQAVPDQAVGHSDAVGILLVDGDDQCQRVADLNILRHLLLRRIAREDLHAAAGHGRQRCV